MIGLDNQTGIPRFTFGNLHLMDGVDFLVAIVGLFAVSEVFVFYRKSWEKLGNRREAGQNYSALSGHSQQLRFNALAPPLLGFSPAFCRARALRWGVFLPIWQKKAVAKDKDSFGTGNPRGIAAPEAGNNAAAGGALVPMLTLGVPGSGTTAVLLALLLTLNITPGPLLFEERPEVVWGLIASLLIANFVLLIMNIPMVRLFVMVLSVPPWLLLPGIMMVSFAGIYSLSGSSFDLILMILFGLGGYLLRKLDVPTVPIILGILLGNAMEDNLRRAMIIANGDWTYLFSSAIAVGLWVAAIAGFIAPMFLRNLLKRPQPHSD